MSDFPIIKSIHFENFKALRNATLPLSRFTLIVGANGSGKSTALQALAFASAPGRINFNDVVSVDLKGGEGGIASVEILLDVNNEEVKAKSSWSRRGVVSRDKGLDFVNLSDLGLDDMVAYKIRERLASFKIFSFNAKMIAQPVALTPSVVLNPDGSNLAAVLDDLRDKEPERFEALNQELGRWIPEFDRILFETPSQGSRSFLLRNRINKLPIKASDLSDGTLFALAFLTLAYLPSPPLIVGFEEPEKGVHPRLFREIRDCMYRLCYPEDHNDQREPTQVIATTHSPYLLDLYKDHPEEVVIAHKENNEVRFERLSDMSDVDAFLKDAPLGEVWYSGILGGVPANT